MLNVLFAFVYANIQSEVNQKDKHQYDIVK